MKVEGEMLRRILRLRQELRLQALGGIVQRKGSIPPSMEEVQRQLVNLQSMVVELVALLTRAAEQDGDTSMLGVLREIQRVLGKFEEPPGGAPADEVFQRAMASLSEKKATATDMFEAAMGQIPVRHLGRPTEKESAEEADLAERLRQLYRKKVLK